MNKFLQLIYTIAILPVWFVSMCGIGVYVAFEHLWHWRKYREERIIMREINEYIKNNS